MNHPMQPMPRAGLSASGKTGATEQVVVVVQDQTLHREILEILSGRYDLVVRRQIREVVKELKNHPSLILIDSRVLAALGQAEEMLPERVSPFLALLDEAHLPTAGRLLGKYVDDFLVRPFTPMELLLRVARAFRHQVSSPPDVFTIGAFRLNMRTGEVHYGARTLPLTRKELALLYALARRTDEVVTRDELLSEVWGIEYDSNSNVLDVHIRSLRRKIEPDPARPQHIVTVRGVGYKFLGPCVQRCVGQ